MRPYTHGFTLVELLIGMVLAVFAMALMFNILTSTAKDASNISTKASLTKEAQIAQQIISGRVTDALYVWPPTWKKGAATYPTTDQKHVVDLAGTITDPAIQATLTPPSASRALLGAETDGKWQIKRTETTTQNRFLALLLPPRVEYNKTECENAASTSETKEDSCYRFFAYYPLRLKDLKTSGVPLTQRPILDERNENSWVLMESRRYLKWVPSYFGSEQKSLTNLPNINADLTTSTIPAGKVVLNNIKEGSLSFDIQPPKNLGTEDPVSTGQVAVKLEVYKKARSKEWSETIAFSINSRNWLCNEDTKKRINDGKELLCEPQEGLTP